MGNARALLLCAMSMCLAPAALGAEAEPARSEALAASVQPFIDRHELAGAVMMLADEGKLKVPDPVEKYLPKFKDQRVVAEKTAAGILLRRPKHPITIHNVLTHTSGLPFASALEVPTLDGLPLRLCAGSYAMTPLDFEPDSRYRYSNAGINTAG